MVEHTQSQSRSPVIRQIQPLHGPLGSGVQQHAGGLGLGVIGLVVGALTASPVLAVAGLLGGIAAGTALFGGKTSQSKAIRERNIAVPNQPGEPADGKGGGIPPKSQVDPESVREPAKLRGEPPVLGATGIHLDTAFSHGDSGFVPHPSGKLPTRKIEIG